MKEKVKIESGMRAEIRTEDGKIYIGEVTEVTPCECVLEEDWQSRKWEAAVAAMQGLLAGGVSGVNSVTYSALMYADAMVKKFKEEEACCK